MIDLRPDHLDTVQRILAEHVPECEVRAFGSRAAWTAKDYSDLDIAVVGAGPLDWRTLGRLKEAFEESSLPMRVDVLDWHAISDSFRQVIEPGYVVVQQRAKPTTTGEWRDLPFSEAVQINPAVSLDRGGTYPFVDMASVNAGSRSAYSAEQREFKGGGSRFKNGDTLMARITPCLENGKIARYRAPDPSAPAHGSTEFIVIRGRPGATDNEFAYYLTQSEAVRSYAIGQMTGTSGRQRVPTDSLDHLMVPLPPLPEQHAIAHVLGTLDDKIELNRRMNETLESMARALFKDWFVDFGPVRAKMADREPYLPPDVWSLFPDRLAPSELGDIPAGWQVKALGDLSYKPQYGYTQSARDEPIGPKFLRITDINKKAWVEWESVPHCEINGGDFKKYRLYEGDVLIARMADPGHGCMIEEEQQAVFASYLIRFRPIHKCHARLLQYWLRSDVYWALVRERGAGTTRVSLNAKVLSEFSLVLPPGPLLDAFGQQVEGLRARVVANVKESRDLASQRDALLPALVSGEVRM